MQGEQRRDKEREKMRSKGRQEMLGLEVDGRGGEEEKRGERGKVKGGGERGDRKCAELVERGKTDQMRREVSSSH